MLWFNICYLNTKALPSARMSHHAVLEKHLTAISSKLKINKLCLIWGKQDASIEYKYFSLIWYVWNLYRWAILKQEVLQLWKVHLSRVQSFDKLHYQLEGQPDQWDDHNHLHHHPHHLEGGAHDQWDMFYSYKV